MTTVTKLIALKPCSFGGKKFFIGDEIPAEYVASPATQEKLGTLVVVNVDAEIDVHETVVYPESKVSLVVQSDGKEMTLEPTDRGIQDVFNVLIGKATDAEAIIKQMDDADALIMLHLADSRKTIKEAAELRAKELAGEQ